MPEVQKPHWAAKCSMNAVCRGCRLGPSLRPIAVSTSRPLQVSASVRQERCGSPSTSTVHTPHVPCPQPYLGDVSPTPRRSTLSKLSPPSTNTALSDPLSRNWTGVLATARSLTRLPEEKTPQVDRQHLAPVPGARQRVVCRLGAFARHGERRGDAGRVEAAVLQRALHRAR